MRSSHADFESDSRRPRSKSTFDVAVSHPLCPDQIGEVVPEERTSDEDGRANFFQRSHDRDCIAHLNIDTTTERMALKRQRINMERKNHTSPMTKSEKLKGDNTRTTAHRDFPRRESNVPGAHHRGVHLTQLSSDEAERGVAQPDLFPHSQFQPLYEHLRRPYQLRRPSQKECINAIVMISVVRSYDCHMSEFPRTCFLFRSLSVCPGGIS